MLPAPRFQFNRTIERLDVNPSPSAPRMFESPMFFPERFRNANASFAFTFTIAEPEINVCPVVLETVPADLAKIFPSFVFSKFSTIPAESGSALTSTCQIKRYVPAFLKTNSFVALLYDTSSFSSVSFPKGTLSSFKTAGCAAAF